MISSFAGCTKVELMRDILHTNIYFTYSVWDSQDSLENYRRSELFAVTWAKTKVLFSDKPEAWSLEKRSND